MVAAAKFRTSERSQFESDREKPGASQVLVSNKLSTPSFKGEQAIHDSVAYKKMYKTAVEIIFHDVYKAPVVQIMC